MIFFKGTCLPHVFLATWILSVGFCVLLVLNASFFPGTWLSGSLCFRSGHVEAPPFGGSTLENVYYTKYAIELKAVSFLLSHVKETLLKPVPLEDLHELGSRLQLFSKLVSLASSSVIANTIDDNTSASVATEQAHKNLKAYIGRWTSALFPWLPRSLFNALLDGRQGLGRRGIVIPTGNFHAKTAILLINNLRRLNCTLPIEVAYCGSSDLLAINRKRLYLQVDMENVRFLDVCRVLDDRILNIDGWAIKPFAVLASSFDEVILMDADISLLENPEILFTDHQYVAKGALFFHDRTLFAGDKNKAAWLRSILPRYSRDFYDANLHTLPLFAVDEEHDGDLKEEATHADGTLSESAERSRMIRGTSSHEQESGLLVMNKKHCLFGLLAACKLNEKEMRDKVTYEHFHGDKETFWVGFELIKAPYAFMPYFTGVIGTLELDPRMTPILPLKDFNDSSSFHPSSLGKKEVAATSFLSGSPLDYVSAASDARSYMDGMQSVVCGNLLHFDRAGRPFWWNGGMTRLKGENVTQVIPFEYYAYEGVWNFAYSCIYNTPKRRLSVEHLVLISWLSEEWIRVVGLP